MTAQNLTIATRLKPQAKSVLVINPKGGVAKTTTVQNLIVAAAMGGYKVLGVDMDHQQGSLTDWYQMRCARLAPDQQIDFDLAQTELPNWRDAWDHVVDYDVMIIDTPPSIDGAMSSLYDLTQAVDFILIPVSTTGLEIRIAMSWMEQFRKRGLRNVKFLMTRIHDTRRLSFGAAQDVLSKCGLIMPTIIPSREDVAKASNAGDAVVEYAGLKGQSEYTSLWNSLKFEMDMV